MVAIDCKSDIGITIGLIDALMTIANLLRQRALYHDEVVEALKDLASDQDLEAVMAVAKSHFGEIVHEQTKKAQP